MLFGVITYSFGYFTCKKKRKLGLNMMKNKMKERKVNRFFSVKFGGIFRVFKTFNQRNIKTPFIKEIEVLCHVESYQI